MVLYLFYLFYILLFCNVLCVRDLHYTDLLKTEGAKKGEENSDRSVYRLPKESNASLNHQSKQDKDPKMTRADHIAEEIPLGHTGRKKFIPLMDQRNKHEDRVNNAMIAGVLLRKENPHVAHPLLTYAHKARLKAQKTQKAMNKIKSGGKIDFNQAQKDYNQLTGFTKVKHTSRTYRYRNAMNRFRQPSSSHELPSQKELYLQRGLKREREGERQREGKKLRGRYHQ